jgi:hypothetical protein
MSSAPPAGGQERLPEREAGASDPALAAAVRIQRRRHACGLATFWLIAGCLLCAGINSTASSNGTPSPSWFVDLTIGFGVAAVAALGVVICYSVAMRRWPAHVRAQAILLEKQRIRRLWGYGWPGRVFRVLFWSAAWLGMALFLGCAVIGVPLAINGVTYLAGAGEAVRWSAAMPVHSDGDAAGSLVIGLLFVFGGVMVAFFIYRRATRVWWPRFVARRARAIGGLGVVGLGVDGLGVDGLGVVGLAVIRSAAVAEVGGRTHLEADRVEDRGAAVAEGRLGEEADPGARPLAQAEVAQQLPVGAVF